VAEYKMTSARVTGVSFVDDKTMRVSVDIGMRPRECSRCGVSRRVAAPSMADALRGKKVPCPVCRPKEI
jgi:hypothetical protein